MGYYRRKLKVYLNRLRRENTSPFAQLTHKIKSLSLGQLARICIGILIIGCMLCFYFPRIFFIYSSSAVVTARLVSIKSPISGYIKEDPPIIGTEVTPSSSLFTLVNPNVDRSELETLTIEREALSKSIEATTQKIKELKEIEKHLSDSREHYLKSLIERTTVELDIAKKKAQGGEISLTENKNRLARKNKLAKKGFTSLQEAEDATFRFQQSQDTLKGLNLEIQRYELQIKALNKGIFINTDGRTDVPYQEQKINDIKIKIAESLQKVEEDKAKITNLNQTIKTKTDLFNRLEKTTVMSPVKGAVWRLYSSKGNYEEKNTSIIDLLDCDNIYMSVTLGGKMFERIKPGQKARVFLSGADHEIEGYVAFMRGGALDPHISALMVGLNPINREQEMEVLVKIDSKQLADIPGDFCHVGRLGDVRF